MIEAEKKRLMRDNTLLWLGAMVIPAIFDFSFKWFASGPVRFPWPILIPLLLVGPTLASNRMLASAIGKTSDGTEAKP
jgi:hypothetical protein